MLYSCFCSSEELWLVQLLGVQNLLQQNLFLHVEMSPLACEEQCQAPVWSPLLFAIEHFGQDSGSQFPYKKERRCLLSLCSFWHTKFLCLHFEIL